MCVEVVVGSIEKADLENHVAWIVRYLPQSLVVRLVLLQGAWMQSAPPDFCWFCSGCAVGHVLETQG